MKLKLSVTRKLLTIVRRHTTEPYDLIMEPDVVAGDFAHRYLCERYMRKLMQKRHYRKLKKQKISLKNKQTQVKENTDSS